ncbi:MAG TPA: hypothetical protein VGU03_10260 [Frateuria sp.]|uniref:hypothetical protein n=1 Tax=Frateuria sp. TaxID=2211372 RepID=UPI002DF422E2|nr:hypothetical protein [Frateuria sp.]
MNASMKRTVLALAVAALFGSSMAYAQDEHHHKIDSAATASVDNNQSVSSNAAVNDKLANTSSIKDETASKASGNIGMNVAAGDNNTQDNATALAATDASFTFGVANSEVEVGQSGMNNVTINQGVTNTASIGGDAFRNASGNVGANVTSGNNNEQKNALAASVATAKFARAEVSVDQDSSGNVVSNAGRVERYDDTTAVHLSGTVQGYSLGYGLGGYAGGTSSTSQGTESGGVSVLGYPIGSYSGSSSSTSQGSEQGALGFVELSASDLFANLSGTVTTSRYVVVDATNDASLSGNAFQNASGNIGANVASGTGNLQANSLSLAVSQPAK